jgi:hypothetical protein
MKSLFVPFLLIGLLLVFTGCAQHMPAPGSDSRTNDNLYNSETEFLRIVEHLEPGMPQKEVFFRLGVTKDDLVRLDRANIINVLYGGANVQFSGSFEQQRYTRDFLRSLYGYRLDYNIVEREHGFSSLIRINTKESGFRYNVVMIFQYGYLFDKPIVSGGTVDNVRSSTFFDFINPGTVMNQLK